MNPPVSPRSVASHLRPLSPQASTEERMIEMILGQDVWAIRSLFAPGLLSATDSGRTANSLVMLVEKYGGAAKLHELMDVCLLESVAASADAPNSLFREDGLRIKIVTSYIRHIAFAWAKGAIEPVLADLTDQYGEESLDINPAKANVDGEAADTASVLAERAEKLKDATGRVLSAIFDVADAAPHNLRALCAQVVQHVSHTLPSMTTNALGGVVFLRFICPILVSPKSYKLDLAHHPHFQTMQPNLVRISKLIQLLANGHTCATHKEPYNDVLNDWLAERGAEMKAFLESLPFPEGESAVPDLGPDYSEAEPRLATGDRASVKAVEYLLFQFSSNMGAVESFLSDSHYDVYNQLQQCFNNSELPSLEAWDGTGDNDTSGRWRAGSVTSFDGGRRRTETRRASHMSTTTAGSSVSGNAHPQVRRLSTASWRRFSYTFGLQGSPSMSSIDHGSQDDGRSRKNSLAVQGAVTRHRRSRSNLAGQGSTESSQPEAATPPSAPQSSTSSLPQSRSTSRLAAGLSRLRSRSRRSSAASTVSTSVAGPQDNTTAPKSAENNDTDGPISIAVPPPIVMISPTEESSAA